MKKRGQGQGPDERFIIPPSEVKNRGNRPPGRMMVGEDDVDQTPEEQENPNAYKPTPDTGHPTRFPGDPEDDEFGPPPIPTRLQQGGKSIPPYIPPPVGYKERYKVQNQPSSQEIVEYSHTDFFEDDEKDHYEVGNVQNFGEQVKIDLESDGRFSCPPVVYFHDWTSDDVNNIVSSREDEIFDSLINTLEKRKDLESCDRDFRVVDMTTDELYEVLLGMKVQFDKPMILHRWMHSCQDEVPESQRKLSEHEIPATQIQFISISEIEQNLKDQHKQMFQDRNVFAQWWENKYKPERFPYRTEEEIENAINVEIEKFKIQEPIIIRDGQNTFYFGFLRVRDILEAGRMANKRFDPLIKQAKRKKYSGIKNMNEMAAIREQEVEDLKRKKGLFALKTSQALTLLAFNDKKDLSKQQKIDIYSTQLTRKGMMNLLNMWDACRCGVHHEFERVCNLCGDTERRLLQRDVSPMELLPFDGSTEPDSPGKLQKLTTVSVYFG